MMANSKLTPKQELFVNEYLKDFNATQSAIRAGYSKKISVAEQIGHENLRKPKIAEAVEKAKAERIKKVKIDAEWVLTEAVDLYKECRHEGDRAQANKSLDTIGKHVDVQAWKEKLELETNISDMSEEQINDRIKQLASKYVR